MNKKLLVAGSAFTLGLAAVAGANVSATGSITTAAELKDCLQQAATATCTLGGDITWSEMSSVVGDITLDLNGYNITSSTIGKFVQVQGATLKITGEGEISTTDTVNTSVVRVYGVNDANSGAATKVTIDKDVTISGMNPLTIYNNNKTAYNTTVDVYGKLKGKGSGLWVIGTISNTTNYPTVHIHDGAVLSASADNSEDSGIGLSAMGYAEYVIDAATITGVGSGIGIKAGKINIDGATVKGTGNPLVLPPETYGNGINASGAALQIEGNIGYTGKIELNINSGTFTSDNKYAVYSYKDSQSTADDIFSSVAIKGGTFTGKLGAIHEENLALPSNKIVNGYIAVTEGNTITVKKFANVEGLEDGQNLTVEETTEDDLNDTDKQKVEGLVNQGLVIGALYEFSINDGTVTETTGEIEFEMDVPSEPAEGYTREWSLYYIHGGELKKNATLKVEDDKFSWKANEFSTYIFAYEDAVIPGAPNTGNFTKEAGSMSAGISIAAITSAIICGAAYLVKRALRR